MSGVTDDNNPLDRGTKPASGVVDSLSPALAPGVIGRAVICYHRVRTGYSTVTRHD